jgi:hypothetical protein
MNHLNYQLDDVSKAVSIEGRRVSMYDEKSETVLTLPKGARVSILHLSTHRARLTIGGFKSTTVSLTGTRQQIIKLRDAVLS